MDIRRLCVEWVDLWRAVRVWENELEAIGKWREEMDVGNTAEDDEEEQEEGMASRILS